MLSLEQQKSVDDLGFNINLSKYFLIRIYPHLRSNILDVGCGVGYFTRMLVDKGFKVTGVDGNPTKVASAKLSMPKTRFVVADFFDFRAGADFNTVLIKNVLEHLGESDSLRLLKKAFGWLRPCGTCIAYVPNFEGLHKRIGALMGFEPFTALDKEVGHKQTYTMAKLAFQFKAAGFKTVKQGGLLLKPFPNEFMVLLNERYLNALFTVSDAPELERYCSGVYIVGRKP
jgi:2-polyprenyl-3-methyl-5-hydroxy-6-metoxy-1,4-benzoquinol methylase